MLHSNPTKSARRPLGRDWRTNLAKGLWHRGGVIALARMTNPAGGRTRILAYHAITDDNSYCGRDISIPPALFEQHLRLLSARYRVLPLDQVIECLDRGDPFPPRVVCITFDDGYLDNYLNAFPLLRRYGLTATFFVAAGPVLLGQRFWVGWLHRALMRARDPGSQAKEFGIPRRVDGNWSYVARRTAVDAVSGVVNRGDTAGREAVLRRVDSHLDPEAVADDAPFMMRAEHVQEMAVASMTIGSHSLNHPVLASLPEDQVRVELESSHNLLADAIGSPVDLLAYPNGPGVDRNFNADTIRLAAATGDRGACTSVRWMASPPPSNWCALELTSGLVSRILPSNSKSTDSPF